MLGDALLYAASRATSSAVDSISRHIIWYIIAAIFLICGLVYSLIVAFWLLEPRFGALHAGAIIAAGCAAVGLICLVVPSAVTRLQRSDAADASPVSATIAAVNEEAAEAVDYFGALQVVGTAFMLGLHTARKLKGT